MRKPHNVQEKRPGKTLEIRWKSVGNPLGIRWEFQSIVSQLYTNSGAKQSTWTCGHVDMWTCGRVGLVGAGDLPSKTVGRGDTAA